MFSALFVAVLDQSQPGSAMAETGQEHASNCFQTGKYLFTDDPIGGFLPIRIDAGFG